MAQLEIRTLGGFDVVLGGVPVESFESTSARALLAFLAAPPGRRIPRPQLAEMCWPDRPPGRARANLRHALTVIRRAIGDHERDSPLIVGSAEWVGLDPAGEAWVDVVDFERLTATPAGAPGAVAAWEQAARLWQGQFLADVDPAFGEDWDTWLRSTRSRLDAAALRLFDRLADLRARSGELDRALDLTRRELVVDRWHEPAQVRLLRLLARTGRTGEALTHADGLVTALADELGVEPTAELADAIDELRHGSSTADEIGVPGLTPERRGHLRTDVCVAREEELAWLGQCLEDSAGGSGRMVFLSGPAGAGKSVLLRSFAAEARRQMPDVAVLPGSCNGHSGPGDPFLPFRQILGLLCGDLDDAWTQGRLTPGEASRLWDDVPAVVATVIEKGPDLLATLVDGAGLVRRFARHHPDDPLLGTLRHAVDEAARRAADPGRAPQPLLDQVVRVLTTVATRRPLLLTVDDAHWADAGTIDLLWHLSSRIGTSPLMVVVAYRPGEVRTDEGRVDPVSVLARETQIHSTVHCIRELSGTRRFVDAWLDTEPNRLDESFRHRLHRTTNGHALFTVETVAAMQQQGDLRRDAENRWVAADSVAWDRFPPQVGAAIEARTSQLPTEMRLDLEAASVQGRNFRADVVAAARGARPDEVDARLAELAAAAHPIVEFVGSSTVGGRHTMRYRFRHDVFRRALENGLARPDRIRLHEGTARALTDLHGHDLDDVAVDLARHLDAAELTQEAIDAHERAGRRAIRLSATAEAIAHLRRAVELIDGRDSSPGDDARTLGLLSALGTCRQARNGYNAPETHEVYERIRALISVVGPTMESAQALGALIAVDGLRARYGAADEGAERLLEMAGVLNAAPIEAVAHTQRGWFALMCARLGAAEQHLNRAVDLYDRQWDAWLTAAVGFHVEATARSWRALVHWYLGRPARARQDAAAAMELARGADSPFSLVFALQVAGSTLHEHLLEGREVLAHTAEAGAVATREGFAFYRVAARVHHGLGSCCVGDVARGLAEVEEGLAEWAALGTRAFRPWIIGNSIGYYVEAGRLADAAQAVHDVEEWLVDGEEELAALWLPLGRGLVARAEGDDAAAETALRSGVRLLADTGAHGPRLRTATALAALLCDHARRDEARAVLRPALEAIEGGDDTADVAEARAVLARSAR